MEDLTSSSLPWPGPYWITMILKAVGVNVLDRELVCSGVQLWLILQRGSEQDSSLQKEKDINK